jgi:hypothetical protein
MICTEASLVPSPARHSKVLHVCLASCNRGIMCKPRSLYGNNWSLVRNGGALQLNFLCRCLYATALNADGSITWASNVLDGLEDEISSALPKGVNDLLDIAAEVARRECAAAAWGQSAAVVRQLIPLLCGTLLIAHAAPHDMACPACVALTPCALSCSQLNQSVTCTPVWHRPCPCRCGLTITSQRSIVTLRLS